MKGKPVLYKFLVVGVIVLLIGLAVQTGVANDVYINNEMKQVDEKIYEYKFVRELNFGFILVLATYGIYNQRPTLPLSWERVECIDLETGEVVMQEKTGRFGFCLFKYLPMRHDYKLIVSNSMGEDWSIVRNTGIFQRVHLHYNY